MKLLASVAIAAALTAPALADPKPQVAPAKPKMLVLPLPASPALDANVARTFDARLLAALKAFKIAPLDGSDRSALTHRVDLTFDDLSITDRRHTLCNWHEGNLVGTFTITELASGRVVFTKTATVAEQRRTAFTSRSELIDIMLADAVEDWTSALQRSGVLAQLVKRR